MLELLKEATYSELHRSWNQLAGRFSPTYCSSTILLFDKTGGQLMTLILRKRSFSYELFKLLRQPSHDTCGMAEIMDNC